MQYLNIQILDQRLADSSIGLPAYATEGSAGLDLRMMANCEVMLKPAEELSVSSGIAINIEDRSLMGLILPRSSLGKQGLMLQNTAGVIDSDYQGEILLLLKNSGKQNLRINVGERIAQLILVRIAQPCSLNICQSFPPSARHLGGFGSTGKT